jgi:S-adenosylmethionine hydrolase
MITLTSDIGNKDYAIAQLKGKMYSISPNVNIVDISHQIAPFNYKEAAYILGNVYHQFPDFTIHIIAIDTEIYKNTNHLIVLYNNHYFIGANNGIISHIVRDQSVDMIIEINQNNEIYSKYNNFDALGIFAIDLMNGKNIRDFGTEVSDLKTVTSEKPFFAIDKSYCIVKIIFKDNFGNLVFNITKKQFDDFGNGRDFEINVKSKIITRIVDKYVDVALKSAYDLQNYEGDLLAKFNEAGYLEIALFRSNPEIMGTVQSLLGLNYNETITINFLK